ncbi:MAG: Fic family protein [Dehalococcoidia bacterium]
MTDLDRSPVGQLVPTVEGAHAFVPSPLPPSLSLPDKLIVKLDRASRAVATLDGVGETLENPLLLVRPFLRREAALSSRIEGTQASVEDVYEFEVAGRSRSADALEVANYVAAMELGIELLRELPICARLAHQVHERLLRGVRGRDRRPGLLRDRQVWIGDDGTPIGEARFVPPPHPRLPELLTEWERWANADNPIPPLVKAALLHYQFETIHPYLDGNGRLGRLLVILYLISADVLTTPLLYLSSFFESHRQAYYDHLLRVSETGDWLPWVEFFLQGAEEQANDALQRSRRLRDLQQRYRRQLQETRQSANVIQLTDALFQNPVVTRPSVQRSLTLSQRGAHLVVEKLVEAGILTELPESRPTVFVAREILDVVGGR